MENSDVKLNELISDLSEPARSIVVVIVLLQKIRNNILSLKKKLSNRFHKSMTKATHIETNDDSVAQSSKEDRQLALYPNPKRNKSMDVDTN
jgi:hypothetical protein